MAGMQATQHREPERRFRPGERVSLVCQVLGWVVDDFPGWIRVRFHDAAGHERTMVDKLPIFGLDIGLKDQLPTSVSVRCNVIEANGSEVVVSTSMDGLVAEDGADEFVVPVELLAAGWETQGHLDRGNSP